MNVDFRNLASPEAFHAILKHEGVMCAIGVGAEGTRVVTYDDKDALKVRRILHEWNAAIVDIMHQMSKRGLL